MKPPYTENVSSMYGAPMGRRSYNLNNYSGEPLHLRRVPLNQGYDTGGAYWGVGNPLYCAFGHLMDGDIFTHYVRAANREEAKRLVDEDTATPARWKH